jgi:nitrite reductase (NADH) small subunit
VTRWIQLTQAENVPPREGRAVRIGDTRIALFHTEQGFLAVENRCPHGGGPLADGIVGGTTVTCPLHNWRVCLNSGEVTRGCAGERRAVRTYPVRVRDGVVMLGLETAEAAA